MPYTTPILFLIFNRPDTTNKVFQRIREIQPRFLFVSADGPRTHKANEKDQCEATRKIIEIIDWDCEVKTHFSDINLGCKIGVSSGINWFFENVNEGIILEDDCLPDLSFFHFCAELLEHYRHDERVMEIGGTQYLQHPPVGGASYYFSQLTQIWGWATWRRAWAKYDVTISRYPKVVEHQLMPLLFHSSAMQKFWQKKFTLAHRNGIDTWDIQWQFTMSINNGLAVIPRYNLVSNIGFDMNATHTIDSLHALANRPTEAMKNVLHPDFIVPEYRLDYKTFRKFICQNKFIKLWALFRRLYSTSRLKR